MHRVKFVADGEVLRAIFVKDDTYIPGMEDHPAKAGQVFVGWVDEQGRAAHGNDHRETEVYRDQDRDL